MQLDFHYYATYTAAYLAGFTHEESLDIAYCAQLVDECSFTLLSKLKAPLSAATTQLQLEMMDARTDLIGLQDITRIWASFHFLPYDLYANKTHCSKRYLYKYRLICKPNGALLKDTVELAKNKGLEACGLSMHILADTWAHAYFAGTPSLVINNTNYHFYELMEDDTHRKVSFRHNPIAEDDLENGLYVNSLYQTNENAIMNLGHGRAGHLPDYSFARYAYLPAWDDYNEMIKDNPSDYLNAFCQMVYALSYLRGEYDEFKLNTYDDIKVKPYKDKINGIIRVRRLSAKDDWKALGESLSGKEIPDFNLERCEDEYLTGENRDDTLLGRFIIAALKQKSMVTNKIYSSKNPLAGYSVDYAKKGFRGIRDYEKLMEHTLKETFK